MTSVNATPNDEEPCWGYFLAGMCQTHFELFVYQGRDLDPQMALFALDKACECARGEEICLTLPQEIREATGVGPNVEFSTDPHPSLGLGMFLVHAFGNLTQNSLSGLLRKYSPSGVFGNNWRSFHQREIILPFLNRYDLTLAKRAA